MARFAQAVGEYLLPRPAGPARKGDTRIFVDSAGGVGSLIVIHLPGLMI